MTPRTWSTLALAPLLVIAAPAPAVLADTCTVQVTVRDDGAQLPFIYIPPNEVSTPPVTVPCPGPHDQPAPTPVWVATNYGPGYYDSWSYWIRIKRGGRIFFVNADADESHAYRGAGFDSGVLPPYTAREVAGVSTLAVGYYKVYDADGAWTADLYVDP